MPIALDQNWPGASDKDDNEDPYANRPEIRRVAGEMHELLKRLSTSSGIPVTEFVTAPGDPAPEPQIPAGAGSLPDLQRHCALGQNQLGEWPAAMHYAQAAFTAYSVLVGEPGSTGGVYAGLVERAEQSFDALLEIARTSQGAEDASEEAAARRQV